MAFRAFTTFAVAVATVSAATAHGAGCRVHGTSAEMLSSFESMASNASILSRQEPIETFRVFAHNVYKAKTPEGGYLSVCRKSSITYLILTEA